MKYRFKYHEQALFAESKIDPEILFQNIGYNGYVSRIELRELVMMTSFK